VSNAIIDFYGPPKVAHPVVRFCEPDIDHCKEQARRPVSSGGSSLFDDSQKDDHAARTSRFYTIKATLAVTRALKGQFEDTTIFLPDDRTGQAVWTPEQRTNFVIKRSRENFRADVGFLVWPEGEITCEYCAVVVYGFISRAQFPERNQATGSGKSRRFVVPYRDLRPMNEIYLPDPIERAAVEQTALL
jgi:hypothetical protein